MNKYRIQVGELLNLFKEELKNQYEEKEIINMICLLFDEWKGWSKARFLTERNFFLEDNEATRFLNALSELKSGKPLQYITGISYFSGMRIKVTPDVLIPRPETEELVSKASEEIMKAGPHDFSLLDIGTGSGCIAITIRKKFPQASVTAIDVSDSALQIARENAILHQCDIGFLQYDILEAKDHDKLPRFHYIISNPPYIPESGKSLMKKNVLDFEPALALFVGDDDPLLFYRSIVEFSLTHLLRPGRLFLEINEHQAEGTEALLLEKGFKDVQLLRDLQQKPRFVFAGL